MNIWTSNTRRVPQTPKSSQSLWEVLGSHVDSANYWLLDVVKMTSSHWDSVSHLKKEYNNSHSQGYSEIKWDDNVSTCRPHCRLSVQLIYMQGNQLEGETELTKLTHQEVLLICGESMTEELPRTYTWLSMGTSSFGPLLARLPGFRMAHPRKRTFRWCVNSDGSRMCKLLAPGKRWHDFYYLFNLLGTVRDWMYFLLPFSSTKFVC